MKVYTARHGQTSWNAEGRMQGHIDIPLNEVGMDQADKLAERFKDIKIDKIYSSSLSRAYDTAKAINKYHNVEIVQDDALREVSYGDFEGRLISEIGEQFQALQKEGKPMPGGEEAETFLKRVHISLDKLTKENDGKTLLIVGHAGTVRAAICYYLELPLGAFSSFGIGNTAVHCFERSDGLERFCMSIENDSSHLYD
ncbi:MAG: histidine phosphatase family protein [Defluviitaleaceae bacterium]|nr:histidine phosphatase family protein [Defluviitaleaceae bacterium]